MNETPITQTNPTGQLPPNNYLVWAILTTLFCCLPFGIVSIIKAAEVNSKFAAGDYEGALASSLAAKKWATIAAIVGGIVLIAYIIFIIAIGSAGFLGALRNKSY